MHTSTSQPSTSTSTSTSTSISLSPMSFSAERAGERSRQRATPVGYLVGVRGAAEDMIIELHVGTHLLGRGGAARIRIGDERMSREHCLVLVGANGKVTLVDLHSSNGSVVNGRRVKKAELEPEDTVCLGNSSFRFSATVGDWASLDSSSVISTDLLQ